MSAPPAGMRGVGLALAVAIVVGGCGTLGLGLGGDDDYRRTTVYEGADRDETWSAILRTFAEMDLPISTLEKESGFIATDWILVEEPDEVMDCDDGERNAEIRLNVFLRTVAGGQEMTITSSARAAREEPGGLQRCASTGELEQSIQARVGRMLE